MKKFASLLTVVAMLSGSTLQAQGNASSAGTSSGMAWGIGLGALAIIGGVVGGVAAAATSSQPSFSH